MIDQIATYVGYGVLVAAAGAAAWYVFWLCVFLPVASVIEAWWDRRTVLGRRIRG